MSVVTFLNSHFMAILTLFAVEEASPDQAAEFFINFISQAKEMERQQLEKAYQEGFIEGQKMANASKT
jgi:hypothetical protein